MPILDDDKFFKQTEKGYNKYLSMAEEGMDYLDIRREAEKDGLEGKKLSLVMDRVDNIILRNAMNEQYGFEDYIYLILGGIILIGGFVAAYYLYVYHYGVSIFPFIIMAIGVRAIFKGLEILKEKKQN